MWFETIIVLVLNGLYLLGFGSSFVYLRHYQYTIRYLSDASMVTSVALPLLRVEEVLLFVDEVKSTIKRIGWAFFTNITLLLFTYWSYGVEQPISPLVIGAAAAINFISIFAFLTTSAHFATLSERVMQVHLAILNHYKQDEDLGIEDEELHNELKTFIDFYTPWLGGLKVLDDDMRLYNGKDG